MGGMRVSGAAHHVSGACLCLSLPVSEVESGKVTLVQIKSEHGYRESCTATPRSRFPCALPRSCRWRAFPRATGVCCSAYVESTVSCRLCEALGRCGHTSLVLAPKRAAGTGVACSDGRATTYKLGSSLTVGRIFSFFQCCLHQCLP